MVELSVTVAGGPAVDFRVTPTHAALLLQFAPEQHNNDSSSSSSSSAETGQQQRGVAALAAALGAPLHVVRRAALFWVAAGVLVERRGPGGELAYARGVAPLDPGRIGAM